jgi:hypothetical protein
MGKRPTLRITLGQAGFDGVAEQVIAAGEVELLLDVFFVRFDGLGAEE